MISKIKPKEKPAVKPVVEKIVEKAQPSVAYEPVIVDTVIVGCAEPKMLCSRCGAEMLAKKKVDNESVFECCRCGRRLSVM